jgi:hypothetical protein
MLKIVNKMALRALKSLRDLRELEDEINRI